jgi:hypothetical protein
MNIHRTTDPALRAQHVADMEDRRRPGDYSDWPTWWLARYRELLREFLWTWEVVE